MTFKPVEDTKAVSREDLERSYASLLASRNAMKANNDENSKYLKKFTQIVNHHIPHLALVIAALAERAGVKNAPAVQVAIKTCDAISHPQWNEVPNVPEFPEVMGIEADVDQSEYGDSEMEMDAAVANAAGPLRDPFFLTDAPREKVTQAVTQYMEAVGSYLRRAHIDVAKDAAGFEPKQIVIPTGDQSAFGWAALDLAQDMHFARTMLRRDLRDLAYARIAGDLYRLANMQFCEEPQKIDIKVMGKSSAFPAEDQA